MARTLFLLYGVAAYLVFFLTFLYAIGFVDNLYVPRPIDGAAQGSVAASLAVDALLLGLFALQHSIMARPGFKTWWTQYVPRAVERSTYVLLASLALILLFWLWRPVPVMVWSASNAAAAQFLTALGWLGWALVLLSTFLINHFELFGLQQVYAGFRRRAASSAQFRTPLFYKIVRHPLYLGFLIAFWAAPTMTLGHLFFSAATTGYIFIGATLEERDLVAHFGDQYTLYRRRVSMIVPWPRKH